MLFPSFRQQQALQYRSTSQGNLHSPLNRLRLLPGFILLIGSPAFAQVSESQEIQTDISPIKTESAGNNFTSQELNNFPADESADLNLTPLEPLEENSNSSEQSQTQANLDSPPSPEMAATLCDGTAQSLSGQIIITSETVCQSGLTPPSLWWTKEQVAQELRTSGKLVNNWSAQLKTSEAPGQVRLVVNPQLWSLMDYFERYDFVSNFGLAARGFGYHTEIYNTKGTRLASYMCQVQDSPDNLGSNCKMNLGSSLNFGSRGSRKSFL